MFIPIFMCIDGPLLTYISRCIRMAGRHTHTDIVHNWKFCSLNLVHSELAKWRSLQSDRKTKTHYSNGKWDRAVLTRLLWLQNENSARFVLFVWGCLLLPVLLVLRLLLLLVHLLGLSLYIFHVLFYLIGTAAHFLLLFLLSSIFFFCLLHRHRLNSTLRWTAFRLMLIAHNLFIYYHIIPCYFRRLFVRSVLHERQKKWASLFVCIKNENKAKIKRQPHSKPNNNRTGNELKT